ncbi:hypothetical protein BB558_007262 [Smittium angustum]|uniref:HAT C-terminal dimerisation domain-containing protein n=1 Tax=Smittium angustum TaxID=133377 RepID=A0A2U1IVR2_SMIAN|nr:hypothetical protein BB558_007262 [Smittium angustum]
MLKKGAKSIIQYWKSKALKTFSMATSSAVSEKNFSTFGFIHSKLLNRLSKSNLKNLVYIKTNGLQMLKELAVDDYESGSEEIID